MMMNLIGTFALIKQSGVIDLKNRHPIIWGAGKTAKAITDKWQLDDIAYVIDSDVNKHEKSIILLGKSYVVKACDILDEMQGSDYFILIASNDYMEIEQHVKKHWQNKYIICNQSNFSYIYNNLKIMLLYDPLIHRKITEGKISTKISDFFERTVAIIQAELDCKIEDIKYYFPVKEGHKISFIFSIYNIRYIFSIPIKTEYGWRVSPSDDTVIKSVFKFRKERHISKELSIYEDGEGFRLEKYAGENFLLEDSAIWDSVLKQIRNVHCIDGDIGIKVDIFQRYRFIQDIICDEELENDLNYDIKNNMNPILDYLQKTGSNYYGICHGDLHHGNIVCFKSKPVIIDWETMCMSDTMYDVCRLLFYLYEEVTENAYNKLNEWLAVYYAREPKTEERLHAYGMLVYCECIEYLLRKINHKKYIKYGKSVNRHALIFKDMLEERLL